MNITNNIFIISVVEMLLSCSDTHDNQRILSRYPSGAIESKYISSYNKGEGDIIWYLESGKKITKTHYVRGKVQGNEVDYYESGVKKRQFFYQDGVANGPFVFYRPDGSKEREGTMQAGHKSGFEKRYYSTGQLQAVIIEKGDSLHFTQYFMNGRKKVVGRRINGKLDGTLTLYDSLSSKPVQLLYKDGNPLNE
jgi:antitoxin component YwqK of YwqJK toxin-antitoxin module